MTDEQKTNHAFARSRSNAGLDARGEIERICSCVHKSGHYATIEKIPGLEYFVSTHYGTISSQAELVEWMGKRTFRFPHKACV